MGLREEKDGWVLLANLDESPAYEVDVTEIWFGDDGRYHLLTASGCSCWDGDYDDEPYDTLDELAVQIGVMSETRRRWNPSFTGAEELLAEAREADARR